MPFEFSVVGNVNIDIIGIFDELPSPDERVDAKDWTISVGGSATNVAVASASLGAIPHLYTALGTDIFSKLVKDELISRKVILHAINKEGRQSVVFIASTKRHRTMFNLRGVTSYLSPNDLPKAPSGSLVHVASKGPEFVEKYLDVTQVSYSPGAALFSEATNISKTRKLIPKLEFLFVNETEALRLEILHGELLPKGALIITRGEEGSTIFTKDGCLRVGAYRVREVVDTTGAGDVFAAVFLTVYHEEKDIVKAAKMASVAGGLAVTQYGGLIELDRKFVEKESEKVEAEWV